MQAPQTHATQQDNLLGICAAIGEDFGFNPLYLRIALAMGLLWNPVAVIGGYAAAGVVVGLSRVLFPTRRRRISWPWRRAAEARPAQVLALPAPTAEMAHAA